MRNFNKLANLHDMFFKRAASPTGTAVSSKAPKPVNLKAPNPMPEDNPIDRLGRNRNFDYQGIPASESGFGAGNAPVPKKLGRP